MDVIDPRFGTVGRSTDAAGRVTRHRYDGLGRRTLEQRPDGNGTRWVYEYCSGATAACTGVRNVNADYVYPSYIITSQPVSGADVDTDAGAKDRPYTKTYYDLRNRVLGVERGGWDGQAGGTGVDGEPGGRIFGCGGWFGLERECAGCGGKHSSAARRCCFACCEHAVIRPGGQPSNRPPGRERRNAPASAAPAP